MGKKGSRRQTTWLRGRRVTRRRLKLVSPLKNGRRDLGERANNCRRMRLLKGRNIGALVDGERVAVVSGESEKSCVVPLLDVSRRGVKILIDIVPVARKGGKDKNLGTGERSYHRGGGRSTRCRGGGREGCQSRQSVFNRIHHICSFFLNVVTLAGRESQRQVDNDANGRALGVDGGHSKRSRGEGNNGNDDGCLSDWLSFYFEGKFYERSQQRRGRW